MRLMTILIFRLTFRDLWGETMDDHNKKSAGDSEIDAPANLGNPQMQWGSDVVAQALRNLDIPYIALVPGASYRGFHDSIVNYLGNRTPQMIVCLHEEHAVSIADGYGKVTEKPMAVALHSNIGLMHATMNIFNAWCDRTPMVMFGATGPVDAHKRRPWADWVHTSKDQGALIRNYVKWDDQPASPEAAVEAVYRANQIASTPPYGPVYVCLDLTVQETKLDHDVSVPPASRYAPPVTAMPPDDAVDAAIEALAKAKYPILMVGRVSRSQEEWDRRVDLAERLGVHVLTHLFDPSAFPSEHPLHFHWPAQEFILDSEAEIIAKADAILSLDWPDLAGYIRHGTGHSQTQKPTDATVIQCSMDSLLANGWSMDHQALPAADINILARPDDLVKRMLERLPASCTAENPLVSRDRYAGVKHWTEVPLEPENDPDGVMSLQTMAYVLQEFAETREVTFARLPIGWPGKGMRFRGPLDYMGKDGGLAVGTGPAHTVGTALALKDSGRTVIGIVGDGDYLMGVGALWSAAKMRLPMMVIIANNRSYYNDERHQERIAIQRDRPVENKWIGQRLDDPAPDLIGMAKAQGLEGEGDIDSPEKLREALLRGEDVLRRGGAYVIDVRVLGY